MLHAPDNRDTLEHKLDARALTGSDAKPTGDRSGSLTSRASTEEERTSHVEAVLHNTDETEKTFATLPAPILIVKQLAHEILNPLQAILVMAEVILQEQSLEEIKAYARNIISSCHHMGSVTRDIAYCTPSCGGQEEVEIDLNERLMEAVKMVRWDRHFGEVSVVTEFQQVPRIRARQSDIDRLLINLVRNAVQAMKGRGRLTLATRLEGDEIAALITDTGCGIPGALLCEIFDPFFTTKDPGTGMGLGLTMVAEIVRKYKGKIEVESQEHKGTTFTIKLPVDKHNR